MTRASVRLALWLRWFRRHDVGGAVMATVFVLALAGVGVYGVAIKHGFHLAGG